METETEKAEKPKFKAHAKVSAANWKETWDFATSGSTVTEEEARALYDLILQAPDGGVAVGIGIDMQTAIVIGRAAEAHEDLPVWVIPSSRKDPAFANQWVRPSVGEFRDKLREQGITNAEVVIARAPRAAEIFPEDRVVSFLLIDCTHDDITPSDAYEAWRVHLAPGAVVAFHDFDHPAAVEDHSFSDVDLIVKRLEATEVFERISLTDTLVGMRLAEPKPVKKIEPAKDVPTALPPGAAPVPRVSPARTIEDKKPEDFDPNAVPAKLPRK